MFKKEEKTIIFLGVISVPIMLLISGWAGLNHLVLVLFVLIVTGYALVILKAIKRSNRKLRSENKMYYKRVEDLFALLPITSELSGPMPVVGNWALSPDALRAIYELIAKEKPKNIVELGSGSSSVLIGKICRHLGIATNIVSLEHNSAFVGVVSNHIQNEGLHQLVKVCHAPLVETSIGNKTFEWYDLKQVRMPSQIDFLVIDGPPAQTDLLARYPALPVLYSYLASDCKIFFDDADRLEERKILALWKKEFPEFEVNKLPLEKGAAVLHVSQGKRH